jgi:pimeloyl-ACP methyl ester carboxylesterase
MESPHWFTRALSAPGESRFVDVEGCAIHYLRWGDARRPGLVIVPPSGGHAHWFDHVAPLFAEQFHVVVLDPSGCGDSGRRETYSQALITAEIMGVCADAGLLDADVRPVLLGHSAGAMSAVRAAIAQGRDLLGVIAAEGLRYAELEKDHAVKFLSGPRPPPRPARVYESYDDAVARFRLAPPPMIEIANTYVIDHIARHSYRQVEGGWALKYDSAHGATTTLGFELKDQLKDLGCRAAVIYAEHTHIADETAVASITAATDGKVPVFHIPGTSHFPMIDSPFAFVAAVNGVALTWVAESRRA